MSKDNKSYLAAYVPESKPKETPKRSGVKSDGRMAEIEEAIRAFNDLLTKQTRDNLDAMYNIDMDNMSSSMRRLFQSYDDGITKANASIKSWADAQKAGFEAIAEWIGTDEDGNLISSAAEIKGTADANHASIEALAKLVDADSKALAGFKSEVSKTYATTAQFSSFQATVNNTITNSYAGFVTQADAKYVKTEQIASVTDEDGNVTAASIAAEIKDDTSLIKLIADKVDITGVVTFESLEEDGGSTINGNNISLVSDSDGESISKISFYHNENYGNSAYEIGTIFLTDDRDYGYSLCINANSFRRTSSRYADASLLLRGEGGVVLTSVTQDIVLSSGEGIAMYGQSYCDIGAGYSGVRIHADSDYRDTIDSDPGENTFIFVNGGIYYIDSYGDPHEVWEL